MPERIVKLREVFGVGREMPLNYVERPEVDGVLVDSLGRDKHVVIYGSSKQGKTTLRKHCLAETDYIVVSCLNHMTLSDLHGAVLKAAGFQIEQSQTKTVEGNWKYGAEFKGEGKVPFVGTASAAGTVERESVENVQTQSAPLEIDLTDVNDVITALKSINFSKFIILEDFHYLPTDTQTSFSFALKAFHENSEFCFIIVGVWREKNRLIYYNGDLTNRVVSIDVDSWKAEHLRQVIGTGENLLNIAFNTRAIEEVVANSFESVALVQEACFKICEQFHVYQTQIEHKEVGRDVDVGQLMREIVNEQAGRYSAFITNFSEGFQQTDYEMYKWIAYSIVVSNIAELEKGLRRTKVSTLIKAKHPMKQNLNEGNVTQALQNTASLQVQKNIRPIIFDYDQTTRVLHVVDRSFLIWLAHQDQDELLAELRIMPEAERRAE